MFLRISARKVVNLNAITHTERNKNYDDKACLDVYLCSSVGSGPFILRLYGKEAETLQAWLDANAMELAPIG